ncbi:MAG: histidine--tRNA ligase [Bacteroidia bacterium]|nr:histidine--tRNA ligase [Bacteroidia bacterium]NNF81226.1 histidine--tRNA ligase [Flavobacteriaceae bacterium]NNL80646.1 histidine--tRNA ligase [Flavobacteriaceae bacterium]
MAQKPRIPKGTRDFSPAEVTKRQYIIESIRSNFEAFGFLPIETPSFELSDTLLGKYGDEGDRLIFRILNSGDYLSKVDPSILADKDSATLAGSISEKALRYDLTVPFARYVVQHQNDIVFPFKRYQIQPVWRADRPQKGRFREFFQCDADVVGSKSLWQEVEFIQLYDAVFHDLKLSSVQIKINNRKILSGIAELIDATDQFVAFTVALDKLDKIGKDKVEQEWRSAGISDEGIEKIQPLFDLKGHVREQVSQLKALLADSETAMSGLNDTEFILDALDTLKLKTASVELDVTLARGLNYYTGTILEVAAPDGVQLGSIGGGGRYDDLAGVFGLKGVSGVGISFGLDRIYLAMEELNVFPETVSQDVEVLFINFGEKEAMYAMKAMKKLRDSSVNCELYPDPAKISKQMNYANRRNIPFVVMAGDKEMVDALYSLKNMNTGDQDTLSIESLITALK